MSLSYRDIIVSYWTSNIEYLDILKASDLFCLFPPKIQKLLRIFRKFSGNSENSQKYLKVCRKYLKKKVFSEAKISYRYRIVSRKKNKYCIDIVSNEKNVSLKGDHNVIQALHLRQ